MHYSTRLYGPDNRPLPNRTAGFIDKEKTRDGSSTISGPLGADRTAGPGATADCCGTWWQEENAESDADSASDGVYRAT
jgi:hypothetical protein